MEPGSYRRISLLILLAITLITSTAAVSIVSAGGEWENGVLIIYYNQQYGTGWWISNNYIVTAGHVVNYQQGVKVELIRGSWRGEGSVIAVNGDVDVAVIKCDNPPPHSNFAINPSMPQQGMHIFVIGYPFEMVQIVGNLEAASNEPRISEGIVSWVYDKKGIFEFDAPTDQGNSGGPIIASDGTVLGLVSFALKGNAATMYYATASPAIIQVLNNAGVNYKTMLAAETQTQPTAMNIIVISGAAGALTALMVVMSRKGGR